MDSKTEYSVEQAVEQAGIAVTVNAAESFDLDDFDDVTTADYVVKHPITGAPTSIVLILAGPEHPARKKQAFSRMRQTRQDFANKGKYVPQDPAEEDADITDMVGRCILGWSGFYRGGVAVPYSKNEAITLVTNAKKRWLRDQVKIALDERELFIKGCGAQ